MKSEIVQLSKYKHLMMFDPHNKKHPVYYDFLLLLLTLFGVKKENRIKSNFEFQHNIWICFFFIYFFYKSPESSVVYEKKIRYYEGPERIPWNILSFCLDQTLWYTLQSMFCFSR